ncbi:ribosomal RNA-processing protein 12-like isoform X1 [Phalaenopsis equestris]|uniref:ribosomal RNA-processing protein 12-like isoform X1 n=1 Tax=Phalaenopsis equestris TaxID=78828 RepID=UPI0009E61F01|nr:ribosomal RNA-processing protein 12-like isoform X1 [Phalaenopsis equestris]
MERYSRSTAKQHRHLCATAAAMQSILLEEGLPLIPSAYFAAGIAAVRDADRADREGVAALSAFVAVVLPLVHTESLPKAKAKEAAIVIASFLRDPAGGLSTGTLRSMVKSLGLVALRVDLEDWPSIELPLETLLLFAVDKRPKVRRCAQSCLEVLLKNCHNSSITKKASKVVHCMLRKYIALVKNTCSIEPTDAALNNTVSKPENLETLHMLNVMNTVLPYISDKVRMKILSDAYELLGFHFSWTTRHILRILEALLEHSDVKVFVPKAEDFMSALASYISTAEKNPVDTIVSASMLLKILLSKFEDAFPSMWIKYLPPVFISLIGYLESDSDTSKLVADILKELINFHINQSLLMLGTGQSNNYEVESSPEASAVASMCSVSDKMLKKCSFPTEHMLEVMSVLFLKLGESSIFFMKEVLITLSQFTLNVDGKHNMKPLEQCIGAAVIAMGPEKLLSLVPLTFDMEKSSCSNSWIIPILKKYVIGASLQYFLDNIAPLAEDIQEACKRVEKESCRKSLQSCFYSLWDLLPSFCRYPIDSPEKIKSLFELFLVVLKEEPSLHKIIASALQVLVNSIRDDNRHCVDEPCSFFSQNFNMEVKKFRYSKKVASKNMKAMASRSLELFQILKDIFFESPDKRVYFKDALGPLAFIIPSEYLKNFFYSELASVEQSCDSADSERLDDHAQAEYKKAGEGKTLGKNEEKRCLLMELASSFVAAADTDLTNIILHLIRSSLLDTNGVIQCEAYSTLSRVLEEKDSYSSAQLDELIELLFAVKPPVDTSSLKNRFSCFEYLLVYILKSNLANLNAKAFLILNEILLTLKSKKASRKMAYDSLLAISGKLKAPHSDSADSDLLHLFSMVIGYLSSSSPHIISAAVSALSLLIYHDAAFCLSVPNLIPAVLVLLQSKANEVIKATLGFIKVLASSLVCNDLKKLLPEILLGLLPWSLVSKNHFRSKVSIIVEILIRKCSWEAVENQTPEKYKNFVKFIHEGRATQKFDKAANTSESAERGKKRLRDNALNPSKKPSMDKSSSSQMMSGKKELNGFSKGRSSSKMMYRTGVSNSHSRNKAWTRNTVTNHKRRYAEQQKVSGVDTLTKKQKQNMNVSRVKKPKLDKLSVNSKSFASSRFNKHKRRSS